MTFKGRVVLALIELATGIGGCALLWSAVGWQVTTAVFLLTWSAYTHIYLDRERP